MIKSIFIKAVIEGSGIVNFDSNDQRFIWNRQRNVESVWHNNVSFGKGRYYPEVGSDGDDREYLKKVGVISADCIRHSMYEDCMFIHLPNVMHDDGLLLSTVAHPAFLERGYMFARDNRSSWKRKSAFALSYARAVTSSAPMLETYSNSQPKTGENKTEDVAETSFFKREVRGDTTYELSGAIDVSELAFISLSDVHDRLSFDLDYAARYRELLKGRMGSEIPEPAFFQKNGDVYDIPECGILLTQAQVKFLTTNILRRLALFNVVRTVTGSAKTASVSIKIVSDPLEDLFGNPDGWVEIFDGKKFDVSAFDGESFATAYTKVKLQEEALQKCDSYKKKFGYEKPVKEEKPAKPAAKKK
ncbi:hypothetical protein M0R72_01420 [Candidatus Pacearchaeota archaeon]|jgi:hypothetical protein|nr:hypothetical protein [Candidatus Pacearchaeota archaeon]